jgi:hypothetical protein
VDAYGTAMDMEPTLYEPYGWSNETPLYIYIYILSNAVMVFFSLIYQTLVVLVYLTSFRFFFLKKKLFLFFVYIYFE